MDKTNFTAIFAEMETQPKQRSINWGMQTVTVPTELQVAI